MFQDLKKENKIQWTQIEFTLIKKRFENKKKTLL